MQKSCLSSFESMEKTTAIYKSNVDVIKNHRQSQENTWLLHIFMFILNLTLPVPIPDEEKWLNFYFQHFFAVPQKV